MGILIQPLQSITPAPSSGPVEAISGVFPIASLPGNLPANDAPLVETCVQPIQALWSDRWPREAIQAVRPEALGEETVVVVDDEPVTRRIVTLMLNKLGYKTLVASDGLEALPLLELAAVTALVTDVEMPEVDGVELITRARRRRPHLPILVHSANDNVLDRVSRVVDHHSTYKSKNEPVTLIPRLLRQLIDSLSNFR